MAAYTIRTDRLVAGVLVLALAVAASGLAGAQTSYDSIDGDPAVLHHYPGPDGLIGNGDDVASTAPSGFIGSDPNYIASYAHASASSPTGLDDPALPTGFDTISFLTGSVTVDDAVATAGGGSLFQALDLTLTQPIQGQPVAGGAASVSIATVNGGSYVPGTGTISVDLGINIDVPVFPIPVPVTTMQAAGTALIVDAADFGAPATGNAYVDNTLVPVAQALGADSLLFVDIEGIEPFTGVPYRVVFAGVAGVVASARADLSLSKTRVGTGPLAPGATEQFVVNVANAGVAGATDIETVDPFPSGMNWVADDCSAGAPDANGIWRWNIVSLPSGNQVQCTVTVEIDIGTVFDRRNGAVAYAAQLDPSLSDNVAFTTLEVSTAVTSGLDQAIDTNPVTLVPSDADCDACTGGAQALADSFRLFADGQVTQIGFSGFYFDTVASTSNAFSDQFSIIVYERLAASGGPGVGPVPGNEIATLTGPVQRELAGTSVFGLPVYRYTLNTALNLSRGAYWVSIFNDSTATGDNTDWFWALGVDDAQQRGAQGIAASTTAPPIGFWTPGAGFQMALTVASGSAFGPATPVPSLSIWAALLLAALIVVFVVLGVGVRRIGS